MVATSGGRRLECSRQRGCRLWANPPYSRWNDYAKLVVEANAEVVCLLPDWGQECLPTLLDRVC